MSSKRAQITVSLQGARQAAAQANGLSGSLERMRRATLAAGAAGRNGASGLNPLSRAVLSVDTANGRLSHSLGLTNKALRVTKGLALAGAGGIAALATSGVRAGMAYNQMEDRQSIAFETLLGSAGRAKKMMADIQALAAKSPILDPANTGLAAQRLLSYGVNAKQVLPLVQAIGDQASASGKSIEEAMGPAALALGQIESKGKLSAEELGQLSESVGLNRKLLAKNLGMTATEFEESFTKGPVAARKALPAILKTLQDTSAGAASKMAKTTEGRLDRLRESWGGTWKSMTRPVYDWGGRVAGYIANGLDVEGGIAAKFAGIGAALDKGLGGGGRITAAFGQIEQAITSAGQIITTVLVPAFRQAWDILQQLPNPLGVVAGAMRLGARHAGTLKTVLGGLIAAYVAYRSIAMAVRVAQIAVIAALKITRAVTLAVTVATQGRYVVALTAQAAATKATAAAQWLLNTAMSANPIVRVITLVAALGVGLVVLWKKSETFRAVVTAAWNGVRSAVTAAGSVVVGIVQRVIGVISRLVGAARAAGAGVVAAFLGIGSAAKAVYTTATGWLGRIPGWIGGLGGKISSAATGAFDGIKEALRGALNWVIDRINGFEVTLPKIKIMGRNVVPGGGTKIGFPDIPRIDTGGTVQRSGWHWVGERGPELMRSPAGTQVVDAQTSARVTRRGPAAGAQAVSDASGPGGDTIVELHTHLVAEGRELARVVQRHRLRELAVA
ncbi:MAG: tape measure protein [Solirubrobacteraceae bacterium]|nr:tape measure protein [Solirubrobacteraceae bacterium]